MYRWIVAKMMRRSLRISNECFKTGDFEPLLKSFGGHGEVVFPGDGVFGGVYRGHDEIRGWLEHVLRDFGPLQIKVLDVVVTGPPWNTRLSTRFTDPTPLYDGTFYESEGLLYDRVVWGKVKFHRIFLDTKKLHEATTRSAAASPYDNGSKAAAEKKAPVTA